MFCLSVVRTSGLLSTSHIRVTFSQMQNKWMPEDKRKDRQQSPTDLFHLAKHRGGQDINTPQPAVDELIARIDKSALKWQILHFLPLPLWITGKNYIVDGVVYNRDPGWYNPKIDDCYQRQYPRIRKQAKPGEFCGWGPIKQN